MCDTMCARTAGSLDAANDGSGTPAPLLPPPPPVRGLGGPDRPPARAASLPGGGAMAAAAADVCLNPDAARVRVSPLAASHSAPDNSTMASRKPARSTSSTTVPAAPLPSVTEVRAPRPPNPPPPRTRPPPAVRDAGLPSSERPAAARLLLPPVLLPPPPGDPNPPPDDDDAPPPGLPSSPSLPSSSTPLRGLSDRMARRPDGEVAAPTNLRLSARRASPDGDSALNPELVATMVACRLRSPEAMSASRVAGLTKGAV